MSLRLAVAVLVTAGVFVVLGWPTALAITPPTPVAEQRVVYVAPDYSLSTVRANGTGRQQVTPRGGRPGGVLAQPLPQMSVPRFTWPTWSPDGSRLVASQTSGLGRNELAALALLTPPSQEPAYLQVTGNVPLSSVAEGTPHYAMWSPDGRQLSLIAPNRRGTSLELAIVDPAGGNATDIIDVAPIYYTWSPDSEIMAIHQGETLYLRDEAGELIDADRTSRRYRVPSFSSDSLSLAYMEDEGFNGNLIVRDLIEGGGERNLLTTAGSTAFAFSPVDPHQLAVAVAAGAGFAGYDRLSIHDTQTGDERRIFERKTYAFWWSPDGTKIAIVSAGTSSFTWEVVDIETGESRTVAEFFPAQDFITYIQFFDQFALSQQVWSEDSTAITFAGELRDEAQTDATDRAWVLDMAGEAPPRPLAPALQSYFVPTGR